MKPNEFIYPEYRSDRSETFGLDPDRNTACTIPYSRNPNWSKIPGILLNRGTLALSKPLFPFYTINITEKYKFTAPDWHHKSPLVQPILKPNFSSFSRKKAEAVTKEPLRPFFFTNFDL